MVNYFFFLLVVWCVFGVLDSMLVLILSSAGRRSYFWRASSAGCKLRW